ncbi:MAG: agenet domain-containing protein [Tepidisphaeraceae bacterium]
MPRYLTPLVLAVLAGAVFSATASAQSAKKPAAKAPAAKAPAATAPTSGVFAEGASVEVREGDTWSSATIVKKEGRKYQIRYDGDDAAEEWVTADRIRVPQPDAAAETPANDKSAEVVDDGKAAAAKKAASPAPDWTAGQKVEVKWGGTWFKSTISPIGRSWSPTGSR